MPKGEALGDRKSPSPRLNTSVGRGSIHATAALLGAQRRWRASREGGLLDDGDRTASASGPISAAPGAWPMPPVHLEDPEWSRAALGLLAGATGSAPAAMVLEAEQISLHMIRGRAEAAAPFMALDRYTWALSRRSGALAALPSTPTIVAASRRSALVTVWNRDASRCLVDLVGCGAVALEGPPVAVGATLSDIVVELASRRWCDLDELIVVGFGTELLGFEGVKCVPDVAAAREALVAGTQSAAEAAGRRRERSRCLVVAPPTHRTRDQVNPLQPLLELVHAMPHTGMICCDPSLRGLGGVWRLKSHRQAMDLSLRRSGGARVLAPPAATGAELGRAGGTGAEIVRLPGGADDDSDTPRDVSAETSPTRALTTETPGGVSATSNSGSAMRTSALSRRIFTTQPPVLPKVLVHVLGPVNIVGTTQSIDRRPRVSELITYLAFHPEGCTSEAVAAALWPERRVSAQTVANRMSEARQALGYADDGIPILRRVSNRHVLSDHLRTDWTEFDSMTGGDSGSSEWTAALEMVRGRPFDGLPDGGWTILEGLSAWIAGRIVDVACKAASRHLDSGAVGEAEKAVRVGMMADPWDERLYRMLMVVHHVAGNRGGVELAVRSLARMLDWNGNPLDIVHPDTAQLYRELQESRVAR